MNIIIDVMHWRQVKLLRIHNEKEVDLALEVYTKRDRRFGGINDETKSN